jgi:hypothetical protein
MGRPSQQLKTNGQRLRRRSLWKQSPRSPQPAVCGRRRTKLSRAKSNRRRQAKPSRPSHAATDETANRELAAIVAAEPQAPKRELAASNGLPELAETERIVPRTRLCRQRKGMFQLLLEPPRRQPGTVRNRRERRQFRAEALAGKSAHKLEGPAAQAELVRRASRAPSHGGAGIRLETRVRRDSATARPRSIWWS